LYDDNGKYQKIDVKSEQEAEFSIMNRRMFEHTNTQKKLKKNIYLKNICLLGGLINKFKY
jgi:hypothetical protein